MVIKTMVRRCRAALACCACLVLAGGFLTTAVAWAVDCDTSPTGVETTDYSLPFEVPAGLMPDPQFDGLQLAWTQVMDLDVKGRSWRVEDVEILRGC